MPQRGQTFFTSQLGAKLEEQEIRAVDTRDGDQFVVVDDLPRHMESDQASISVTKDVDAIATDDLRDNLRPGRINDARSERSQRLDEQRDAEVTTDPLQWASSPDEYDFPGVDTGPRFEETFGGRDPETLQRTDSSFFDF